MKNSFLLLVISILFFNCAPLKQNITPMESWKYPQSVQYLDILDNQQIAYTESGEGKYTLLFIHGLGSNLKAWEKNIEALQKDYKCIAIDLPGYGKSQKGEYAFDMSFFASSVNAFIQKKNLKHVVLVGHSMGGQVSVKTIMQNKIYVEKLILVAPAGFEKFSSPEYDWFKTFYTPDLIKKTSNEQIVKNFELNFHQMPEDAQYMIDDRMTLKADEKEYDFYCRMIPKCLMGMLNQPIFTELKKLKTPTLIIFGANDQLIPNSIFHPEMTTDMVAQSGSHEIFNSKLVIINEAGHFVNWEKAQEVNSAILKFLN